MNRHTWTLGDGRALIRDGARVTNLQSRFSNTEGYPIPPAELDMLARRVVGLLEATEPAPGWTLHEYAAMIAEALREHAARGGYNNAEDCDTAEDLAARFDAMSDAEYFANLETHL